MDIISAIILCALVIIVMAYLRNTVLELRKLNKEFNKFYKWIYRLKEKPTEEVKEEEPEKKKEMNPRMKDFLEKGKIF